jgi:hypothetical protein
MRSILEKAIVHLLNGDQDKAEALFHKFMVEKARTIHESLRQDEDIDLGEGWDNEVKEEEYFDDNDLASAEDDHGDVGDDIEHGDSMDDLEGMNTVDDDGMGDDNIDDMDMDGAEVGDEMGDEMGGEPDGGDGISDKLDDIESKIEELTAEFDRLMSEFEGDDQGIEGEGGDEFDDEGMGDTDGVDGFEDEGGEEPHMDAGDQDDLVDRMDTDMNDEEKPESDTMESMEAEGNELDEELNDITESVLSELDRIAPPSNSEGHEIGSGGKNVSPRITSMLPNHNNNDRISGKPVMVKGGNNDSFEREEAPTRKGVETLVKSVRNVRKSATDKMTKVPSNGDSGALLNHDYAGKEPKSPSLVTGTMKPKTS